MILELFFSNADQKKWNFLLEKYSEGLGNTVLNLLNSIEQNRGLKKGKYDTQYILNTAKNMGLNFIGGGDQRDVYDIDGDYVIKIAIGYDGFEANKDEANLKLQGYMSRFVPRVYESDPDGAWVIMDKVIPLKKYSDTEEWMRKIGLEGLDFNQLLETLVQIGERMEDGMDLNSSIEDITSEDFLSEDEMRKIIESPLVSSLFLMSDEKERNLRIIRDLIPQNIGFTANGDPVILDWGG